MPARTILTALGRSDVGIAWKNNRRTILSWARDRRTIYVHASFRQAPAHILRSLGVRAAELLDGVRQSPHEANIKRWVEGDGARVFQEVAARKRPGIEPGKTAGGRRPRRCAGTPAQARFSRECYGTLNRERFGGALPDGLPIILSTRMSRRYGDAALGQTAGGRRTVHEIGLNIDLLLDGNEHRLVDTLLHEMAHASAWLLHGDRGHGIAWKAEARRVGCQPERLADEPLAARKHRRLHPRRIPDTTVAELCRYRWRSGG